jgi:hypothetical protein
MNKGCLKQDEDIQTENITSRRGYRMIRTGRRTCKQELWHAEQDEG